MSSLPSAWLVQLTLLVMMVRLWPSKTKVVTMSGARLQPITVPISGAAPMGHTRLTWPPPR
jgi:hypothetical protein